MKAQVEQEEHELIGQKSAVNKEVNVKLPKITFYKAPLLEIFWSGFHFGTVLELQCMTALAYVA